MPLLKRFITLTCNLTCTVTKLLEGAVTSEAASAQSKEGAVTGEANTTQSKGGEIVIGEAASEPINVAPSSASVTCTNTHDGRDRFKNEYSKVDCVKVDEYLWAVECLFPEIWTALDDSLYDSVTSINQDRLYHIYCDIRLGFRTSSGYFDWKLPAIAPVRFATRNTLPRPVPRRPSRAHEAAPAELYHIERLHSKLHHDKVLAYICDVKRYFPEFIVAVENTFLTINTDRIYHFYCDIGEKLMESSEYIQWLVPYIDSKTVTSRARLGSSTTTESTLSLPDIIAGKGSSQASPGSSI